MNHFMRSILKHAFWAAVVGLITLTFIGMWLNEWIFIKAFGFALIGGVMQGIAAGFINYRFAVAKYLLNEILIDLEPGENIVTEATAHFTNTQNTTSGKLFLTNRRFIFKSYWQTKNKTELNIPVYSITSVHTFKTLHLFNNGLMVQNNKGEKFEFITEGTTSFDAQASEMQKAYIPSLQFFKWSRPMEI